MLELEAAQERLLGQVAPLGWEEVAVVEAHQRFLAQEVISPVNLPPFDNSAMDGYAVRAEDTAGASAEAPRRLQLVGRVAAGESARTEVASGHCARIFTGSSLPAGADAVVMQEDTRVDPGEPETVCVADPVKPWENVRFRGEDVKQGTSILQVGMQLHAAALGLCAACGFDRVRVGRKPMIGLLATGNELREPGEPLADANIYESNRVALHALATSAGAVTRIYPIIPDTLADTRQRLDLALAECDAVITTGGVSVGEYDFVKSAFQQLGGTMDFWRVAIKPGKPFVFGRAGEKLFFGLPGNPVSALVTFLLLVRPALIRLQGGTNLFLERHSAVLMETIRNPGDRRHFVRVTVDQEGQVRSAGHQASHLLASLAASNALLDVPPKSVLDAGRTVTVLRWT